MSPRLPKPWAMMMYNAKSMNNLEWERLDRFQASTLHCSCAYIYADHLGMYQTIHRLITATQVSCHAAWCADYLVSDCCSDPSIPELLTMFTFIRFFSPIMVTKSCQQLQITSKSLRASRHRVWHFSPVLLWVYGPKVES